MIINNNYLEFCLVQDYFDFKDFVSQIVSSVCYLFDFVI